MRPEALWDRTSDETREDVRRARARGQIIVALSSYASGGATRHATVWRADPRAPEQRFEPDVEAGRAAGVLARHAREGFHPVLIGMVGPADRPVIAFVLERRAPDAPAPWFAPPRPFRDARGTLFVERAAAGRPIDAAYPCSLAVAGAPEDASGAGLVVAGVWAPAPPTRVAWAVHLDAVDGPDGAWRERWEPRALEAVARPVQAIPITSSSGARWMLSLWHDRPITPWPAPDPFARTRRFTADEALGSAAIAQRIADRRDGSDQRVIALGAGHGPDGTRFIALYGEPGRDEPLERRFVAVEPGDDAPARIADAATPDADHPLDRWALQHMRETGARHGQLVVVRGRRLAFARAYTYAEAGYPVARLDDAMRLGSVSKALTAAALLAAIDRRGLDGGVDARVVSADLLDRDGRASPRLAAVTLRHLLAHDAGLRSFVDVGPDEPQNPLSEHRLTELLDGARGPARPGQLAERLRARPDDEAFTRAPGGGAAARLDYSNEGFILLGEILARIARGSFDAYEQTIIDALLRPAGVEPGARGCLLGAGRRRAWERRESPAHPSSPTWVAKRFPGDDLDEGPLALAPYDDNGPFLGGAAGWSVPLVWIARVLAALGPRAGGSGLWQREHADLAASPAAPGSRQGLGFFRGEPGWWTFRSTGGAPLTLRVTRLHHNGRLDGGAALLIHQMPEDPQDDALDATLSVAVAFNLLGPLYDDPHGRQLYSILRQLEGSPGWDTRDLFSRLT